MFFHPKKTNGNGSPDQVQKFPVFGTQQHCSTLTKFDEEAQRQSSQGTSLDAEIAMWSGVSRFHRKTNPIHAMEGLKLDHPRVYKLFRKYSIFPATQNKDERLFSLVARNTGPMCQRIKVDTITKKVVVGSAVQRHGFIFDYTKACTQADNDSSSDSADYRRNYGCHYSWV